MPSATSSSCSTAAIAGMCAAGPQPPLALAPTKATLSLSSIPAIIGHLRKGRPHGTDRWHCLSSEFRHVASSAFKIYAQAYTTYAPAYKLGIVAFMADSPDPAPRPVSTRGPRLFSEEQAKAFLGLIRAGAALERVLDRGLADEQGIGLHQFEVLLFLASASADHSMPMTELRRHTPLSQSRVSRVVSGLETEGLVRREDDPTDSRAINVVLTPHGMATFEAARPRHQSDLDDHLFSILTDVEIRQLATITTKLLAAEQNQR